MPPPYPSAAGVDAGAGEELRGGDVGGGKAESLPALGAVDDLAAEGVGASEAFHGVDDATVGHEPADEAAGDVDEGKVGEGDLLGGDDDGVESEFGAAGLEQCGIAFGASAEGEGGSLDQEGGADGGFDDITEELFGGHAEEFARGGDDDENVGGAGGEQFLALRGDRQRLPDFARPENDGGVGIEGHDGEGGSAACGFVAGSGEHFGVAAVDAVEVSNAQYAAAECRRKLPKIAENLHGRSIHQFGAGRNACSLSGLAVSQPEGRCRGFCGRRGRSMRRFTSPDQKTTLPA